MQDIYFHLPGLFEFFEFYQYFLYVYSQDRDKFYEWANIGSIYGAPRDVFWNGGRFNFYSNTNEDAVILLMREYNIPCRFTFSNSLLEEKHLSDVYCNMILEKFNWEGHKNQVIVNSPILEEYIRKNYPSYGLISSITKCITKNNDILKEMNKDYDMTVLNSIHNKNIKLLEKIENKDKTELIVNPVCNPGCPRIKEHYEAIDKMILHQPVTYDFNCPNPIMLHFERLQNPTAITIDEIKEMYVPMGFKNFKIEGRNTSINNLIEILVYYMVKPEHQLEIRQKLMFKY